jgi:sugar phosphate isomerase/epimerase
MNKFMPFSGGLMLLMIIGFSNISSQTTKSVFSKENITPWCVVPFDAKKRNPEERAEMLHRLGFKTFAYDWRNNNIPEFDEEVAQLKKYGITMTAFWWTGGLPENLDALKRSETMKMQIDFFIRNNLKLTAWVMFSDKNLQDKSDEEKYIEFANRTDILAKELEKTGCSVGLYNHGGWGGVPHNLVEILKRVKSKNVSIVYNFSHGHQDLEKMPGAFDEMLPYLSSINLNGMNKDGQRILPLGQGKEDVKILRMIKESGYNRCIGIIGEVPIEDVEIVLKRNLEGLKKLLVEIGDTEALKTY